MDEKQALEIVNQAMMGIFGKPSPWELDEFMKKFAFDIKLPVMVYDSTTGEETWAESMNSTRYIMQKNESARESWMILLRFGGRQTTQQPSETLTRWT